MQLRSGKTVEITNANAMQSQCGNTNVVIAPKTTKGKFNTNIVAKHSMNLRSAKSKNNVSHQENAQCVSEKTNNTNYISLRHWLIRRINGFVVEFQKYNTYKYSHKERVLDKIRVTVEITAVMIEYIDYIMALHDELNGFSHKLHKLLHKFKNSITITLNENTGNRWSNQERTFMGNARADIVKLITTMDSKFSER